MTTLHFTLPAFYAPLLINGDMEGYTNEELSAINKLIQDNNLNNGHWALPNDEVSFTTFHDLWHYGILAADCSDFTYVKMGDNNEN